MIWYTYDFEVFSHDWLVCFKEFQKDKWTIIHNNPQHFAQFIRPDNVYFGFNSKAYDQFIAKAILGGFDVEDVKAVNDFVIDGGNGWEYPPLQDVGYTQFNNVDITTDMQQGLSLKAIEGHLGMNIKETDVAFDIPRPLTPEEIEQTIYYCKHDVETTEKIVELRMDYLNTKISIGELAGLDPIKSMSMTNAKLTAAMLKARPKRHDDERDYKYPENLKREYIPQEVFDFFDKLGDKSLTDEEVFKRKMKFKIGECEVVIGLGGIHSAIPHYMWKEGQDVWNGGERVVENL